jgi:hypothetical protein
MSTTNPDQNLKKVVKSLEDISLTLKRINQAMEEFNEKFMRELLSK